MEIRHYEHIYAVVPTANVVEGRFGVLTTHTFSNDYGSDADLPGFKVPATAEESKQARYVVTWPVDNRPYPAVLSYPSIAFSLRYGGFDQTANLPATLTLYGTNPANQEGLTIPSGFKSLAFSEGIITLPSGCYINHASIVNPGAAVTVANTAVDTAGEAGKLKYSATYDADTCIGRVQHYDTTTGRLTVILD